MMPTSSTLFKMDIKPKEPPIFRGTANEDVDSWLAKVEDFIYLTEANARQQVAYMATLLQEAAGDWWTALLKERHGSRPADYAEMSALLRKRFGSSTRVDRARAALRNIKQLQTENVRTYSTRFEALLAKLPSFDGEWAKSQYIWGLNQRVAELVVIAEPADLHAAILKAEKIEMARGTVSGNLGQSSGGWPRGNRGRFLEGVDDLQQFNRQQDQVLINPVKANSRTQDFKLNQVSQDQEQIYSMCSVTVVRAGDICPSHCPSDRSVQFRGGRGGGRKRKILQRPRKRRKSQEAEISQW